MSASREKKTRQNRDETVRSPHEQQALDEQKYAKRTTVIFAICSILFLLGVAAMALWNSNTIQRNTAAVRINGETYSAADVAYFYYNTRAEQLNSSSSGVDASTSLRTQTAPGGMQTWYDIVSNTALDAMSSAVVASQAAREAGYDGGDEVNASVSDALSSIESSASTYGYTVSDYLKALYGPLMTRAAFERNLRMASLASAYSEAVSDPTRYTDEELRAADPNSYSMVSYEYALFTSPASDSEDTDADAALEETKKTAETALERYQAGESLEAVSEELGGTYASSVAYYNTTELAEWLFDDARKEGDTSTIDYYGIGYFAVVFHGKEVADYHPVSVRHILVTEESEANDILAQYQAGEQTEEAFAALAQEHSQDNADDGGLYEDIHRGDMVAPFDAWCFDSSRKSGDTGIVQTQFGYHVMYFVGTSEMPAWKELAAQAIASDWSSKITENIEMEPLSGMKYIDN